MGAARVALGKVGGARARVRRCVSALSWMVRAAFGRFGVFWRKFEGGNPSAIKDTTLDTIP